MMQATMQIPDTSRAILDLQMIVDGERSDSEAAEKWLIQVSGDPQLCYLLSVFNGQVTTLMLDWIDSVSTYYKCLDI